MFQLLKRKCTNSNQQYCENSNPTSTTTIVVSVIVPVVVILIGIGFFAWRAWRKNRKEALEDDDPDFVGDHTVLPDYPTGADLNKSQDFMMAENPFETDSSLRYPNKVIEDEMSYQNRNISSNRQYSGRVQQNYYESPQLSINNNSNILRDHRKVDSFVLPYAEDIGSKNSLEQLSKQLGGAYQGYKLPNESASRVHSTANSRRSSVSQIRGLHIDHTLNHLNNSALSDSNRVEQPSILKAEQVYSTEGEGDDDDDDEIDFDRFKDTQSTPEESVFASSSNDEKGDIAASAAIEPSLATKNDHKYSFDESGASIVYTGEDSKTNKKIDSSEPTRSKSIKPTSAFNANVEEPELNTEEYGITTEEEEQINRMKSVYKVYFSRENSIKSKKSQRDFVDETDLPPLPSMPQHIPTNDGENNAQQLPQEIKQQQQLPQLTVDTSFQSHQHNPRASYASSVYISNPAPASQQQSSTFYPHQHIQNMMNQQQMQPQQMYQQYPPQQQRRPGPPYPPQQRRPSELKRLENLPSPHEFHNRNSVLDTFTDFQTSRKYSAGGKPTSSPSSPNLNLYNPQASQNFHPLDNNNFGNSQTSGIKPSPHQIRSSIVMFNPTDINYNKIHKPKGTLTEQVRKVSSSSNLNSPISNAFETHNQFDTDDNNKFGGNGSVYAGGNHYQSYYQPEQLGLERPHGAENLIPRSGSQADLRRAMDNANL